MDKVEEILETYKRLPAPDQYKVAEKILNIEDESTNGFDTQNMRLELNEVCHNRETCNYCPIKDEFGIVDCDFEEMTDKKIVEIYDKILGCNRVEKKFYRLNLWDKANMYFFVNATSKKEAFEIIKRHRNFLKVMNLDICEDDIEDVDWEKLYEEEKNE